ncbi:MAG: dTDP-4-dehydrorhamnose reductase [Hyphomicrobiales bacterium]|nr:dTDP-4-dehydrorhamnose reductase [Hyphomicrobiales bacterium]
MSGPGAQPILVVGAQGQIARALARLGVIAGRRVIALGRPELDLTDADSIARALDRHAPAAVVNAAAYTAVDKAETDEAAAFRLNADGPGRLAALCAQRRAPLVHFSTDYVFDGSACTPYSPNAPLAPLGVYGRSKAEGEAQVAAAQPEHLILRTAWVYSEDGHNFLKTMLRLGAERSELRIVADQTGSPSYAKDVADAAAAMLAAALERRDAGRAAGWGVHHVTNAGETTWFGFATEIFALSRRVGGPAPKLTPIATADYPTPARRPAYSVLDGASAAAAFVVAMRDWREALADCFARLNAFQTLETTP